MQTEPPKAVPPKRNRRWLQFSLRTLTILATAIAVIVVTLLTVSCASIRGNPT